MHQAPTFAAMNKITEAPSHYDHLEKMEIDDLVHNINQEDQSVATAVAKAQEQIVAFIAACLPKLQLGGRLFYMGAGTSGRLGILDASECPPTFGVSAEVIQGLIAGGDRAIRIAVEGAEDSPEQAAEDLKAKDFNKTDCLLGITASGTTPYVLGALEYAKQMGAVTGGFSCNEHSPVSQSANYPITVVTGPEFVTGSTRMKAGTATKMVLNTISTALMIKLGHVSGNRMVDMQLSNNKLVDRGSKMIAEALNISYNEAKTQLLQHGSVRKAIAANTKK